MAPSGMEHEQNGQRPAATTTAGQQTIAECYLENGYVVFTEAYHLRRGSCCGSGCRHCPFEPKHHAGSTTVASSQPLNRRTA